MSGIFSREIEFNAIAGEILKEQLHLACLLNTRDLVLDSEARQLALELNTSSTIERRVIKSGSRLDGPYLTRS
jgi:hypothetical protein